LISAVEVAFGIKFKLREILGMKNVGDLIDLLHIKKA
jgi:acyl carrier protein